MWAARSPCGPTGGTTLRAPTASSGWWTAPTASACRTASGSSRTCWWRSAWPERPSSSLPTSKTCPEHCPLTPSARPWSWTPSVAITGASRAAAPSPGRTCCLASTGSWMISPAASSWLTEPLLMLPHPAHSPGAPPPPDHQAPSLEGWESTSPTNSPRPPPYPAAAAHRCSVASRLLRQEPCHPGCPPGS